MRRQLIIAGFTVLAAGVLLLAIIMTGKAARNVLRDADRYQIPFSRIDTPSPPGLEREAFLGEIRYYGEFPETVSVLDDSLPERLRTAAARHPWVERVDAVELGPGRRVRMAITFRTPVLAVVTDEGGRAVRAVDARAILLPRGADTLTLPHFKVKGSAGTAGKPWEDPLVVTAATVAGQLHSHQDQLKLTEFRMVGDQLRLRRGDAPNAPEVIWGRGDDSEPPPARKLQNLREQAHRLQESGGAVIDLRRD